MLKFGNIQIRNLIQTLQDRIQNTQNSESNGIFVCKQEPEPSINPKMYKQKYPDFGLTYRQTHIRTYEQTDLQMVSVPKIFIERLLIFCNFKILFVREFEGFSPVAKKRKVKQYMGN